MFKLVPILAAALYGFILWWFSAWRLKADLDAKSAELVDPALRRVTDRMAAALEIDRIRVHLYEVEPVNGLAVPDGRIFITRGFYQKFRAGEVSPEEMASVIAHELGHVALGHARRRMIDFSGQNALRTAIAMVLSRVLPGIGALVANAVAGAVAARLSRGDEFAADEYASALLVKAGIGTGPQKSLFRKLHALTGARGSSMPAWFLSHPKVDSRIAAIEANERRWGIDGNSGGPAGGAAPRAPMDT